MYKELDKNKRGTIQSDSIDLDLLVVTNLVAQNSEMSDFNEESSGFLYHCKEVCENSILYYVLGWFNWDGNLNKKKKNLIFLNLFRI